MILTVNTPQVLSEDGISGPDTGTTGTVSRTGSTSGDLAVTIVFDPTEVTINGDSSGSLIVTIADGSADLGSRSPSRRSWTTKRTESRRCS